MTALRVRGRPLAGTPTRPLRSGGEQNSLLEGSRWSSARESLSSTVLSMRSKISTGHYCPHGQSPLWFLDMTGAFAEFETNLRKAGQFEGIASAKARGVYG
jgi:hypothetical protein